MSRNSVNEQPQDILVIVEPCEDPIEDDTATNGGNSDAIKPTMPWDMFVERFALLPHVFEC